MKSDIIPAQDKQANMPDYAAAQKTFRWEDWEKSFSWSETGKVNIAYEAIDRKAEDPQYAGKYALIFDDDTRKERLTYRQMRDLSNKFGNVLRKLGIKKGDRVFIFMPRAPELYVAFVGCAKIGAIFGPLFEAFMESAVKDRLEDSEAVAIVTTPEMVNRIPIRQLPHLKHVILVGSQNMRLRMGEVSWEKEMAAASYELDIEWVDREDPLYLMYTSGSTGKPKGVIHVHNDMIGHLATARWAVDLRDGDVLWTTADPGWVTGTVYGAFAPWLCGVDNFIRGGRFDVHKWYKVIQDYKITVWYSAPTAFRIIMAAGDDIARQYDLSSLRLILSVGEPLNPEVVYWGKKVLNLNIHDCWWMTETGMMMISNYPSMDIKPGSMGKPFPGVKAAVVDEKGNPLPPNQMGELAVEAGWPNMMRRIWKNEEKYQTYFERKPWYISGDTAFVDEEGYFFFQGRDDDVIKTSGERVGPFEVESALISHPAIAEAGVIGKPDAIKGNIIKAFISLKPGFTPSEELEKDIMKFVKTRLAGHAAPKEIEFRASLPKTRSGKIVRRVLKAWELGLPTGDLSTLEDEG